jgi:hypothetical protein
MSLYKDHESGYQNERDSSSQSSHVVMDDG